MVIIKRLEAINQKDLLEIIRIRLQTFVVEQQSIYLDIDGKDDEAYHFYIKNDNEVIAYARLYLNEDYVSFGRFLVSKEYRGQGYANKLISSVLNFYYKTFNNLDLIIEAQKQASKFYQKYGLKMISDEFMLDGIIHVKMAILSDKWKLIINVEFKSSHWFFKFISIKL